MPATSFLIPFRSTDQWRLRALAWIQARLDKEFPEAEVIVRDDGHDGPWCKADAVGRCLGDSRGEIVVVHDSDVWIAPDAIKEAIAAVVLDGAGWAIPHRLVLRLSQASTERVYAGEAIDSFVHPSMLAEFAYKGRPAGGVFVLRRETYQAYPMPRMFGWGAEDDAHNALLSTLAGPPTRLTAPLYHLWHPSPERLNRRFGNPESERKKRAFLRAMGDPEKMRALIKPV